MKPKLDPTRHRLRCRQCGSYRFGQFYFAQPGGEDVLILICKQCGTTRIADPCPEERR